MCIGVIAEIGMGIGLINEFCCCAVETAGETDIEVIMGSGDPWLSMISC